MKYSSIVTLALTGLAAGSPVRRQAYTPTDVDILNYALTLEHLEDAFYRHGLENYTAEAFTAAGYDDTFYKNIQTVASDEATHVSFITTALEAAGAPATKECTYAFPSTDVTSFLAVAAILEGVGVSAYLGAAASIMSRDYLTAAGSILTVEARHTAYIRAVGNKQAPFAQPFDSPLSLNQVYTLAAAFIVACPEDNPPLPVRAFPTLTATSADEVVKSGSTITLATEAEVAEGTHVFAAFITVTGPIFGETKKVHGGYETTVPEGVNGQSYVVLTCGNEVVSDDNTIAGPAIVEVTNGWTY